MMDDGCHIGCRFLRSSWCISTIHDGCCVGCGFFFFHLQLCMMMTVIPHTDCCSNESGTRGQSCRIYYTRKGEPFFELVGGLARAHPSDEFSSQHLSKPKATMALNPFPIVFLFLTKKGCLQNHFFFFHINPHRI
jgi:hypothetical protein